MTVPGLEDLLFVRACYANSTCLTENTVTAMAVGVMSKSGSDLFSSYGKTAVT